MSFADLCFLAGGFIGLAFGFVIGMAVEYEFKIFNPQPPKEPPCE